MVWNIAPQKLRTQEVGFQIQSMSSFRFLADFWTTTLNRELFQPAPGLPAQDIGRSRREGFDLEGRYFLLQDARGSVSMFANYTQLRTRLIDRRPSIVVPNVPQSIVNLGTDFDTPLGGPNSPHRLSGLVYFQLIGQKNLTEDGLITTNPYERIGGRLAYSHRSGWTGFVDVIWYPGDRLSETAFNFGPATGASPSDIVVSPQPPVTVLGGVSYRFRTGS